MSESFHLTVLTPERALLEAKGVTKVQAQLADGGPIGIYPGHAPLLAETVTAPLRYADASGEHTIDLGAGILQVNGESVTVFADLQTWEGATSQVLEDDKQFDQLAQDLHTNLDAQPEGVLGSEEE